MTLLAELRALLAKATPGPWGAKAVLGHRGQKNMIFDPRGLFVASTCQGPAVEDGIADAALIAAAVNALPALLDVAEAAGEHAWHNCQCGANYSTCSACRLREALAKLSDIMVPECYRR